MKVAILTDSNPRVKYSWLGSSWSGLHYYLSDNLEKNGVELIYLGPVYLTRILVGVVKLINNKFFYKLFKKNIDIRHTPFIAKIYAYVFSKRLKREKVDLIFCPSFSMGLVYLETDIPIVYYSDVTFELLNGYYAGFSNFYKSYENTANQLEKQAFAKCDKVLFASQWAANSALNYYNVPPEKVGVIPFGGNIDKVPDKSLVLEKKLGDTCKLVFIGIDWERKGGKIAYDALIKLLDDGIDSELTICGCVPPKEYNHEKIKVIPFLDKGDPEQYKVFEKLLLESHIFILPTRAECFGLVFCEANAFGLPAIATNTGGIGTAIISGKNGYLMELSDDGAAYAKIIKEIFQDKDKFKQLSISSRNEFDERLNWNKWAEAMLEAFDSTREKTLMPSP